MTTDIPGRLAAAAEAVQRAQAALDAAVTDRDAIVREALDAGMSLRRVARLVGLSHVAVAKIRDR